MFFITVIFEEKVNGYRDATFKTDANNDNEATLNVYAELSALGISLSNVRTIRVDNYSDFLKVS